MTLQHYKPSFHPRDTIIPCFFYRPTNENSRLLFSQLCSSPDESIFSSLAFWEWYPWVAGSVSSSICRVLWRP